MRHAALQHTVKLCGVRRLHHCVMKLFSSGPICVRPHHCSPVLCSQAAAESLLKNKSPKGRCFTLLRACERCQIQILTSPVSLSQGSSSCTSSQPSPPLSQLGTSTLSSSCRRQSVRNHRAAVCGERCIICMVLEYTPEAQGCCPKP